MKKIFFLLLLFPTLYSCNDDSSTDGPSSSDFNRAEMLANWADNLIIPAYQSFSVEMVGLNNATTTFTTTPNEANLSTLRSAWIDAYMAWQSVSMFEIGKAEELNFRNYMNIYPVNTTEVDQNIANGTYDLSLPSFFDAQGFPALDYLLNGVAATETERVALYSTGANAVNYKKYLTDVVTRMFDMTTEISMDWQGTFRDEFVNSDGSTANASVDKLVNDYLFYYEKSLRAGKVGIPAGVFSATPLADKVEAFYQADISRDLLIAAIDAATNFYEGNHFNGSTTGESLKSYLVFLNTSSDGEQLSTLISNQFAAARTQVLALDGNLNTQVTTDNNQMLQAYDELQKNVVFMKIDMLQALDINVAYVDADGD